MDALDYPLPRETRQTAVLSGDGGATYGPFPFKIFDNVDVKALVRKDDAGVFAPVAFTVTKTAGLAYDTFSITLAVAIAATDTLMVVSARLHERLVSASRGGAVSAAQLEKELSKQGTVIQELRRDVDRGLKSDYGQEGLTIDAAAVTAGKTLMRGAGDTIIPGPDADEIAKAQIYAQQAGEQRVLAETARNDAEDALADAIDIVSGIETLNFNTRAGLNGATVAASVELLEIREYATEAGGGGVYRKKLADPGHAFSTTSNGGTVFWEAIPDEQGFITPEAGGFTDVSLAATAAADAGYKALWLSDQDWAAATWPLDPRIVVDGPGARRVIHEFVSKASGEARADASHLSSRRGVDRAHAHKSATSQSELVTGLTKTYQDFTSGVEALVLFDGLVDTFGGYKAGSATTVTVPPGCTLARISGSGVWANFVDGYCRIRAVGSISGELAIDVRPAAIAGHGNPISVGFSQECVVAPGETISLQGFFSKTGAGTLRLDLPKLAIKPSYLPSVAESPNRSVKIFQASWANELTHQGSIEALAASIAKHRAVALSGIWLATGGDPALYRNPPQNRFSVTTGPWLQNTAQFTGYRTIDVDEDWMYICLADHTSSATGTFAEHRAANPSHWRAATWADYPFIGSASQPYGQPLIRKAREFNPQCLIGAYVDGTAQARYYGTNGDPLSQLSDTSITNIEFYLNILCEHPAAKPDFIFYDHCAATFMTAAVLDKAVEAAHRRGFNVMLNTTFASLATAQFVAGCASLRKGDFVCCEGFLLDGGADITASTNAFTAEWNRLMLRREVGLALIYEYAPGATIDYDTATNTGADGFVTFVNSFLSYPDTLIGLDRSSYDGHFGDLIL